MTKPTVHLEFDTITYADAPISHFSATPSQPGHPDRRRRVAVAVTVTAAGAAAILGLAAGWGLASPPSHAPVAAAAPATPASGANPWTCDLDVSGVSGLSAALDSCLGRSTVSVPDDVHQAFFSPISAIPRP